VEAIAAIMVEPVGCLAEFPAEEFDLAARELFGAAAAASATGSQAYWRLLGLLDENRGAPASQGLGRLDELELAAVERAELYEDVRPSLEAVRATGVQTYLVSSLPRRALARFVERFDLAGLFSGQVARDDARGVMVHPLRHAMDAAGLTPRRVIYLADTAEALAMARQLDVNALLLINDYDEGRALAEQRPIGGLVSLAELADALRLIEQRAGLRRTERMPQKPFELFEPG
jgi:phosphoglycolate phosphatase-like HAD superfamily hydrolase